MSHPRGPAVLSLALAFVLAFFVVACTATTPGSSAQGQLGTVPDSLALGGESTQWLLQVQDDSTAVDLGISLVGEQPSQQTVLMGSGMLQSVDNWGPLLEMPQGQRTASVWHVGESQDCAHQTVVAGLSGSSDPLRMTSVAWRGPVMPSMVGVPMTWAGSELIDSEVPAIPVGLAAPIR